jgi:hypothetical protein
MEVKPPVPIANSKLLAKVLAGALDKKIATNINAYGYLI